MSDEQGTKIKTSITLSPYLYEWMTGLVKNKTFVSNSDVITTALSEMKGRMEDREERVLHSSSIESLAPDDDRVISLLIDLIEEVNDRRNRQHNTTYSKKVTFR